MTYMWHILNFKILKDCLNVNLKKKIVLELMKQILLLFDYLLTWAYYLSIFNSGILSNSGK